MNKAFFVLVISLFFGLAMFGISMANEMANTEKKKSLSCNYQSASNECHPLDFRYFILFNEKWTAKVRRIHIFLDERAYSKENLSKLFRYFSDKNPNPKHLTIEVSTNWRQLPDCAPIGLTNQPDKPDKYDYYQAVFSRRYRGGLVEFFHYYPKLKSPEYKEVIMKGRRNNR